MSNVKKRMDIYFDHRAPSIVVDVPEYRDGYVDIRKRGGKIRAFTEITKDNVNNCKELIKLVDELRHLNRVKGGLWSHNAVRREITSGLYLLILKAKII